MTRSKKILHVAWLKARYGGAHKYLDRLVKRLLNQQYLVTIAVNQQELDRPFLKQLEMQGATVIYLPLEFDARKSAKQIDELIERERTDIVHFNSGARQPRSAARHMVSWQSRRFCSVFTMHLPLVRAQPNFGTRVKKNVPFTRARKRLDERVDFARRFDRIISVSERFAAINVRELKLNSGHIVTIPNGVDVTKFTPVLDTDHTRNSGKIVIGGCGGLVPQKRFDLLIDAIAVIGSASVTVRIAGEGPERDRLQEMINRHGLGDQVYLEGHVADVPAFLRQLDIFVMPSDYEAFPYSQLEAMATGLPSVVTDVGDLPLLVRDDIDGLVIPTGDSQALSAALKSLMTKKNKRMLMGKSARDHVVEHFEQQDCESRTVDLFSSLLNREMAGG